VPCFCFSLCSGTGLCPVDVLVLLPAGLCKAFWMRWGIFPAGRVHVVLWWLTLWAGRCQLWGLTAPGVGQKNGLGVGVGLDYSAGPFPKGVLLLLGFSTAPLGYHCCCQRFRIALGSEDQRSTSSQLSLQITETLNCCMNWCCKAVSCFLKTKPFLFF